MRREFVPGQRLQHDLEFAAGHAELLHVLRYLFAEFAGGLLALARKFSGELHIRRACIFYFTFKLAEAGVVVFDVVQLGTQTARDIRQAIRFHAMLAREFVYRSHAPLDLFQSLRIELEAVEVLV